MSLAVAAGSIAHAQPQSATDREERLRALRDEIVRAEGELKRLEGRERGVLGELTTLGTELRLRQSEYEQILLRLEEVSDRIEGHDGNLVRLNRAQEERRRYLAFRLREIYKAGPEQWLRRVFSGGEADSYWLGLGYASYLSQRDGEVLAEYRTDALRIGQERDDLQQARSQIEALRQQAGGRRDTAAAARERHSAALRRIREDRGQREEALEELREAALALSGLVDSLPPEASTQAPDIREFRGRLQRPASGRVSSGFGIVVHPKFGTEVPHPGWDIEAPMGANISSVFDGRVVYADWMRGYGLTVIVDHGGGILSIYAHFSVLVVKSGQSVARGQSLGRVGDTGSLRGAYLYFELRVDGQPVDPADWLSDG